MPGRIPDGLLVQVAQEGRCEIHPGLVRQADENEEDIGQLIREVQLFLFVLEALVSLGTGQDPGDLPHLLDELGEIGQL